MPRPSLPAYCLLTAMAGCASTPDDSGGGTLPPEETGDTTEDSGLDTFSYDTSFGDTGIDTEPKHLLTREHEGRWEMSPNGGPWTDMTGELLVIEYLDGNDLKPTCELRFALTGQSSDDPCPGCDVAFDILHYVAEGVRDDCMDPELPLDGATVRMGWSDRDQVVYQDYLGTGVWLPWYDGERIDDEVTFAWEATAGVVVPEEDE